MLLYIGLNLLALALAARSTEGRGWKLLAALFAAGFGLGIIGNFLEAVFFGVMEPLEALELGAGAAVLFLVMACIAWPFGRRSGATPSGTLAITPARLAAIVAVYELLYFGAGILVFPFVSEYYETRTLPPMALIAALQIVRALLFVCWVYPLLRLGPRRAPLVVAILFAVVGGIAPLVPDNALMPGAVRFAHGIEVGTSNLLFGFFVGWLLTRKRAEASIVGKGPVPPGAAAT